jgi:hypothetical protein
VLAGQLQAHVVLGQQDVLDARVDVGLVLREPQQLGRGEARERAVAGQLHEPREADPRLDLVALRLRAPVVPQDRRPQRAIGAVERDEPVHLARQPDTRGARGVELLQHLGSAAPPVLGVLFAPPGARRRQRVGALGDREHRAALVDREALDRRGADVEPDEARHDVGAPNAA